MRRNGRKSAGESTVDHDAQLSFLLSEVEDPPKMDVFAGANHVLLNVSAGTCDADGVQEATKVACTTAPAIDEADGVSLPDHAKDISSRFPILSAHQFYRPGSTKAELVRMLNDCIMKGRFPRNARNMKQISRKHFAQALGVTPSLLSGSEIILAYEGILETVEPLDTVVVGPGHGANPDASEPMDANALQVVFLHPELLKHQHYPVGSSAREVVAILNGQICNGGLERSRGGKISRKVVTRKLGLSQTVFRRAKLTPLAG